MKKIFALLMLVAVLPLSGCFWNDNTTADIDRIWQDDGTGDAVELDRQGAWAYVSAKKLDAAARIAEAEAYKAKAEAAKTPTPAQITIDSAAELQIYQQIEQSRIMAEMMKQQAETVKLLAGALNPNANRDPMAIPAQPKSGFAEAVDSVGHAVVETAKTPAALATSVGVAVGTAVRHASPGVIIGGDMVGGRIAGDQAAGRDLRDGSTTAGLSDDYYEQHQQIATEDSVNDQRPTDSNNVYPVEGEATE